MPRSDEPSRTEGDVLDPTNPYAATKARHSGTVAPRDRATSWHPGESPAQAAAEAIARSYWTSFKLPVQQPRSSLRWAADYRWFAPCR